MSRHRTAARVGAVAAALTLAVLLTLRLSDVIERAFSADTGAVASLATDPDPDPVQDDLTPFETAENDQLDRCQPGDDELASCGPAPELRDTQRRFNAAADVSLRALRGRVVLVDFFSYSCTNCRRDAPYVERWSTTYAAAGLTVVGIHAPMFTFDQAPSNLRTALAEQGIDYPVVQDNHLATFQAYRNRYWPAKYLIDPTGTVRAVSFGEGGHDRTESLIRELLSERDPGVDLPAPTGAHGDIGGATGSPDNTPEAYLSGYLKAGYAGTGALDLGVDTYRLRDDQPADSYSIGGTWEVGKESITSVGDRGSFASTVRLHYRASEVYSVLGGTGTVRISRPGEADTVVAVGGIPDRVTLVENDETTDETITLTFSAGVEAYTLTFG